jgi:antitoxin YefM
MLAVNIEDFGKDYIKKNLKKIVEDKEEMILTDGEDKQNLVILSLDKYNELLKNIENAKYLAKVEIALDQMILNKKMSEMAMADEE